MWILEAIFVHFFREFFMDISSNNIVFAIILPTALLPIYYFFSDFLRRCDTAAAAATL